MKFLKIGLGIFSLASVVLLSGCATRIGGILDDVGKYENQTVTVRGEVTERVWFEVLSRGAFQLTDSTGEIWVTTRSEPPELGATVTVKGRVESAVSIGDRYFGTVIVLNE